MNSLPKDINESLLALNAAWTIYNEVMAEQTPQQPLVDTARRNIQERKRELIHVLSAETL